MKKTERGGVLHVGILSSTRYIIFLLSTLSKIKNIAFQFFSTFNDDSTKIRLLYQEWKINEF